LLELELREMKSTARGFMDMMTHSFEQITALYKKIESEELDAQSRFGRNTDEKQQRMEKVPTVEAEKNVTLGGGGGFIRPDSGNF